jgi:hypothetical protein
VGLRLTYPGECNEVRKMKMNYNTASFIFTVLFLACALSTYVGAVEKSLVLYFPFDEVKGDTVDDQSGNRFEGTLIGGVEFTGDGKYNGALSFDGTSGLVRVEDDDKLDLEDSFTVMAWAYPTTVDGGFRWVADKSNTNADLNCILGISSNNQFRFITRKLSNDVYGGFAVTTEKWYHVAGVQDSQKKEVILYVDGTAVGSIALTGGKTVNDAYLSIGCRKDAGSPNQFFGGIIDEFAAFSRALTESEIEAAMKGIESFLAVYPSSSLTTTWGQVKTK